MATNSLPQFMLHPAWEAVVRTLDSDERWKLTAFGKPGGYHGWQIALAMRVAGFGADVIIADRDAEGRETAYIFPDRWIPVNEDVEMVVRAVAPQCPKARKTSKEGKKFGCNQWLIQRHFDEGARVCNLIREYAERHMEERGWRLTNPEKSARHIVTRERSRRGMVRRHRIPVRIGQEA